MLDFIKLDIKNKHQIQYSGLPFTVQLLKGTFVSSKASIASVFTVMPSEIGFLTLTT